MKQFLIPQHVKALIFDMDGTVLCSKPAHIKAWRKVMQDNKRDFTEDDYEKINGLTTEKCAVKLGGMYDVILHPQETQLKKDAYYKDLIHTVELYSQTIDIIQYYQGKLPIALGTNEAKEVTHALLQKLNLKKYFVTIITSEDVPHPKPAPDLFLKCSENMEIEPQYCHVFEDSPIGIQAAKQAGMTVTDVNVFLQQKNKTTD